MREQWDREWSENSGLVYYIVKGLWYRKTGESPDDEQLQEAICHGWTKFLRLRETKPELELIRALRFAAKHGFWAAFRGQAFVQTRPNTRYVDAMDRASRKEHADLIPETREDKPDVYDREPVEKLIAMVPEQDQPVARMLSLGMSQRETRKLCGLPQRAMEHAVERIGAALEVLPPLSAVLACEFAADHKRPKLPTSADFPAYRAAVEACLSPWSEPRTQREPTLYVECHPAEECVSEPVAQRCDLPSSRPSIAEYWCEYALDITRLYVGRYGSVRQLFPYDVSPESYSMALSEENLKQFLRSAG